MAYDIPTYLLDRANIHDTITTLGHALDAGDKTLLTTKVYAQEIDLDYAAFFGADGPTHATSEDWSRTALAAVDGMTATQHIVTSIVAYLPQPSASASERPGTCKAVANVSASLVREGARGGALMQNGGHYEFELVRVKELEEQGQNPWRISFHKAVPTWENGNWAVFSPPNIPPIYPKNDKTP
ncbi:uncharacterized protein CTRU02_209779 [Colletotrichum truncatum]|uniref:Uncharacterized protein n=1 Tax=Colletotrichum truncatum TaxID=5467 RepID=A0ACC3YTF5_COLTU|nr:uncharacterized protein CTRU02_02352 [Colletotrichum truncatum]KAF6798378.1 hypothetical protein CTRU02_02352 [Colletotrichum truncatum]